MRWLRLHLRAIMMPAAPGQGPGEAGRAQPEGLATAQADPGLAGHVQVRRRPSLACER